MNILSLVGGAFTANNQTRGDFLLSGEITIEVPTTHNGNTEDLSSGTLALQITTDGGDSYRTYTDTDANAATLTSTGVTMRCYFAGVTRCRLNLTGSTTPDVTCVEIKGWCRVRANN